MLCLDRPGQGGQGKARARTKAKATAPQQILGVGNTKLSHSKYLFMRPPKSVFIYIIGIRIGMYL